ncbi:MAG: tol-pal system protein YbgF [Rhodospirillales bacterium]|nr:tol-pal system protein YbgF [Rhodospirillales bacterium]
MILTGCPGGLPPVGRGKLEQWGIGMMRWFWAFACIWTAVAMALAGPSRAWAQKDDTGPLYDRLERLERDIRTLNTRLSKGGLPPSPAATGTVDVRSAAGVGEHAIVRFQVRLSALEEELRLTTGKMEETIHLLDQIQQRLDKLAGDVDFRLGAIEKELRAVSARTLPKAPRVSAAPSQPGVRREMLGTAAPANLGTITESELRAAQSDAGAGPQPAAPTQQVQAAQSGLLPGKTPKERYTFAFGLLRQANYEQAEKAFKEFLRLHGDDPLAGNARYWLGETFYVREDFAEAAKIFFKNFQKEPRGPKGPDTLLKLGMSFAGLNKKRDACAAYDKMIKDFPEIPANLAKTVARERQRSGCR